MHRLYKAAHNVSPAHVIHAYIYYIYASIKQIEFCLKLGVERQTQEREMKTEINIAQPYKAGTLQISHKGSIRGTDGQTRIELEN